MNGAFLPKFRPVQYLECFQLNYSLPLLDFLLIFNNYQLIKIITILSCSNYFFLAFIPQKKHPFSLYGQKKGLKIDFYLKKLTKRHSKKNIPLKNAKKKATHISIAFSSTLKTKMKQHLSFCLSAFVHYLKNPK